MAIYMRDYNILRNANTYTHENMGIYIAKRNIFSGFL